MLKKFRMPLSRASRAFALFASLLVLLPLSACKNRGTSKLKDGNDPSAEAALLTNPKTFPDETFVDLPDSIAFAQPAPFGERAGVILGVMPSATGYYDKTHIGNLNKMLKSLFDEALQKGDESKLFFTLVAINTEQIKVANFLKAGPIKVEAKSNIAKAYAANPSLDPTSGLLEKNILLINDIEKIYTERFSLKHYDTYVVDKKRRFYGPYNLQNESELVKMVQVLGAVLRADN